jgi:hypothetical protein
MAKLRKGRRYIYRGLHATMSVYPPQAELEDMQTGDWITLPLNELEWFALAEEPVLDAAAKIDCAA